MRVEAWRAGFHPKGGTRGCRSSQIREGNCLVGLDFIEVNSEMRAGEPDVWNAGHRMEARAVAGARDRLPARWSRLREQAQSGAGRVYPSARPKVGVPGVPSAWNFSRFLRAVVKLEEKQGRIAAMMRGKCGSPGVWATTGRRLRAIRRDRRTGRRWKIRPGGLGEARGTAESRPGSYRVHLIADIRSRSRWPTG